MNDQIRTQFQLSLAEMMKGISLEVPCIKATRKGLKVFCPFRGCLAGELYFEYLKKAMGFYVGCEVSAGLVHEMCTAVGGEWGSILLNNSTLSFTSLAEENREFSDEAGGVVRLYDRMDVDETIAVIREKVIGFQLMKIKNLIECRIDLLGDLKKFPTYYSRPLVLYALCMRWNGVKDRELLVKFMSENKKIGRIDVGYLEKKILSIDSLIPR